MFRVHEKYRNEFSFRATQARRKLVRGLIGGLVHWEPRPPTAPGYTVLIGCNSALLGVLSCNLRFLARQDLRNADRVLVVVDRPRSTLAHDAERALRERFPSMPLEFTYYTARQRRICDLLAWPWVQAWLSWSIGIARTDTRHALLHDQDAMLLRASICEERFRAIVDQGVDYLGVKYYQGNGLVPEDRLATTFELMFDAAQVREHHVPLDLFNQVTRYRGRRVDFDTFLHAQSTRGSVATLPIAEEDMVHPSQLICQFEDHRTGRRAVPPKNGLPIVPYFRYVGDEPELLRSMTEQLEQRSGASVDFEARPLDLSRLPPAHIRWLAKQAFRLEVALSGEVRPEVRRYFSALDAFVARATGSPPTLPPI